MEPKICPYLCLIEDENSHVDSPFSSNACYRVKPPVPVALSYQKSHCLSDLHTECPGFINGWINGFPESLRAQPSPKRKLFLNKWLWIGIFAAIVLIFLIIFIPQILSTGQNLGLKVNTWLNPSPAPTQTLSPTCTLVMPTQTKPLTATATITPSETLSPTATQTTTPTLTRTPAPSFTPTYEGTPGIQPFIYLTETDAP